MENFIPIYDKPGEPTVFLCPDSIVEGTDEEINAAGPGLAAGVIITTAGYSTMKQKGLDGSWVSL